jgi:hypothetical protein
MSLINMDSRAQHAANSDVDAFPVASTVKAQWVHFLNHSQDLGKKESRTTGWIQRLHSWHAYHCLERTIVFLTNGYRVQKSNPNAAS